MRETQTGTDPETTLYPLHNENLRAALDAITHPAEGLWSEEQRREIQDFEEQLTHAERESKGKPYPCLRLLQWGAEIEIKGIRALDSLKVTGHEFFPEAFLSDPLRQKLLSVLELPSGTELTSISEVEQLLSSNRGNKEVGVLAQESIDIIRKRMFSQIQSGKKISDTVRFRVITNPKVLEEKVTGLYLLKDYYKQLATDLKQADEPTAKGKAAVVTMHQTRLNELIADTYSCLADLIRQHDSSPDEETTRVLSQLVEAVPGVSQLWIDPSQPKELQHQKVMRTLARAYKFIYGVDSDFVAGDQAVVPVERTSYDASLMNHGTSETEPEQPRSYTYAEFEDILDKVEFTPEETKELLAQVLSQQGIYNPDPEYDPNQVGFKEPGKYQVVIVRNSKRTKMMTNTLRGSILINQGNRTLKRLLTGIVDEDAHAVRYAYKQKLPFALLRTTGMSRAEWLSEALGKLWKEECLREELGMVASQSDSYLDIFQTRQKGYSFAKCVETVYLQRRAAKQSLLPDTEPEAVTLGKDNQQAAEEKTFNTVFNITLKLFAEGGILEDTSGYITSSRDVVYNQTKAMVAQIKAEGLEKLLLIGGMNPFTAADLARVGLLDIGKLDFTYQQPWEVLRPYITKKLQQKQATLTNLI